MISPNDSTETPVDNLLPFPEKGKPPVERIKDAESLRGLYQQYLRDDELSARNRAVVQSCIDGAAPYDQESLRLSGAGYRHNLNLGLSASLMKAALSSYTDLVDSVDTLAYTYLPITAAPPTVRDDLEQTIAEEFHRMVRDWDNFDSSYQRGVNAMTAHGVGWVNWPDGETWKFQSSGWDKVLIPRNTKACEDAVEAFINREPMLLHTLYKYIEDEETATKLGWNVEEVKKHLVRASYGKTDDMRGWRGQWAVLQENLKNNNLWTSSNAQRVNVLNAEVRGFKGKYSHYICGDTCGEFLFKAVDRFSKATNCFVSLTNQVPSNEDYHGIRGLAYDTFPAVQAINRLYCAVLDGTMISNSIFLQPEDASAMEEPPLTINGPVSFLNPSFKAADVKFSNPASESLAIISDLKNQIQQQTPSYRSGAINTSGEKTKYELQISSALEASLSVSAVGLFYQSWKRVLAEMFRRVQAIRPTDSGFPEVVEFYKRCADRGVPADLVKKVNRVEPVKAVGYGSASQRIAAFNELLGLLGSLDPVGRNSALRDALSARFGRAATDRYLPRIEQPRPVIDVKVAELENAALHTEAEIHALPGEDDYVHCDSHFNAMFKATQVWEQLRLENNLDFEKIGPELAFVQNGLAHVKEHIASMEQQGDKTRESELNAFKQAFQQLNGIWMGFVASYQRYLRDNRRQSEDEIPDPDQPLQASPEAQQRMIDKSRENEQELAHLRDQQNMKTGLKAQEIQQDLDAKRQMQDLEAANLVRTNAIKNAQAIAP